MGEKHKVWPLRDLGALEMTKGICAIKECRNDSHPDYWIGFAVEGYEAQVQVNICETCYAKVRNGLPYSI